MKTYLLLVIALFCVLSISCSSTKSNCKTVTICTENKYCSAVAGKKAAKVAFQEAKEWAGEDPLFIAIHNISPVEARAFAQIGPPEGEGAILIE